MYMGDRWNAAGPGSVARASYVWLPLLPVHAPSGQSSLAVPMQMHLESPILGNLTRHLQYSIAPELQHQPDHGKQGDAAAETDDKGTLDLVMQSAGVNASFWRQVVSAATSWVMSQSACWALKLRAAAVQAGACLRRHGCNLLASAGGMCRVNKPWSNAETFTLVFKPSWRLRDFMRTLLPA